MTEPPDLVGRYHIERLLAHGGMGSVYLARDPAIDRLVVIKLLKAGFDDAGARERFAREARAAGRLHHPNIVTIFDVGEHDDRPFIAMEYVSGETLAQLIARRAVKWVSEKLAILEELCSGLHYAHTAAIVHRDIKPANVMRETGGAVKILDFGIARGGGAAITGAGEIVGTLNYMAPEQLAGGDVDHRADVYAVGVLAYELITGQMAFPGTVPTGVLFKILNDSPVPIDSVVPGIDPDISAMVERAMAREPDERYQDLRTLREDLEAVRARLIDSAPELDPALDSNAETRFDAPRVSSASLRRPSSRAGSTSQHGSRAIGARPSGQDSVAAPRRVRTMALLGVAGAALAGAVMWTVFLNRPDVVDPSAGSDSGALSRTPPSTPSPAPPTVEGAGGAGRSGGGERERELSTARVTARQQIAAGQRGPALDTAVRGLALDDHDRELNAIVDEMTAVARRNVSESRRAAAARGARARTSAPFREGQARELEAETLLRGGDRVAGIRAAWAAATLYDKAREDTGPSTPLGTGANASTGERAESTAVKPGNQPVAATPSPEQLRTLPGRPVDKPASVLPPPPPPKPEAATAPRDPAPDPRAADIAAVRETLRRYTQAYQSLDAAAVGRMMPSLTADQLRDLGRDLSNYRRYSVEIKDERIDVGEQTATVTCQVVRSFETRNGVAGSNTVPTVFHLRRSGSGWTIDRLASRGAD